MATTVRIHRRSRVSSTEAFTTAVLKAATRQPLRAIEKRYTCVSKPGNGVRTQSINILNTHSSLLWWRHDGQCLWSRGSVTDCKVLLQQNILLLRVSTFYRWASSHPTAERGNCSYIRSLQQRTCYKTLCTCISLFSMLYVHVLVHVRNRYIGHQT